MSKANDVSSSELLDFLHQEYVWAKENEGWAIRNGFVTEQKWNDGYKTAIDIVLDFLDKKHNEPTFGRHTIEHLLIKHGIVQSQAVNDAEGYDGGVTLSRIHAFEQELIRYLSNKQKGK